MRHMAYLLAKAGWTVRALSTTLSEAGGEGGEGGEFAATLPPGARHECAADPYAAGRGVMHVSDEGVEFELIECLPAMPGGWEAAVGTLYDRHYAALLETFQPDVVLTFGGGAADVRRRALARAAGAQVVFALHNQAYLRLGLEEYDHLLAPSHFLAQRYAVAGYGPVQVLAPPLWPRDVLVERHQPVFFTFVNPERAKGAEIVARLAVRHPDLPFLVVESRARSGHFLAIAADAGIAAGQLDNVMVSPGLAQPREIFAVTRALLMPSLVEEAAGRLAAEALANGIPALVSDSGGLPEIAAGGGTVLVLARNGQGLPVIDAATMERWSAAVAALSGDDHYAAAVCQAAAAGRHYDPDHQLLQYARWFGALRR